MDNGVLRRLKPDITQSVFFSSGTLFTLGCWLLAFGFAAKQDGKEVRIPFDSLILLPTLFSILILILLNALASRTAVLVGPDEDLFLGRSYGSTQRFFISGGQTYRFFIFGALVSALAVLAWSIILAVVRLIPKGYSTLGYLSVASNALILFSNLIIFFGRPVEEFE